ncbi:hypothetical protein GF415_04625 [Candidatus Micrarchaeota archaeon]|nr:hypothetical protein [Candidatus Micrarchaeota archaeon]
MRNALRQIRKEYSKTRIEKIRGKAIIRGLPLEMENQGLAAAVLSSYSCRLCAKCCSAGFSFSAKEPHYETIMKGVKREDKKFKVIPTGRKQERVFLVFPGKGESRCGFLEAGEGEASIPQEILQKTMNREEGAPFRCRMYGSQPSVCRIYPMAEARLKNYNGWAIVLDPMCPAITGLLRVGIGHLTDSDIDYVGIAGGGSWGKMAGAFSGMREEVVKRIGDCGGILENERGERIYPVGDLSVVPILPWNPEKH